MALDQSPPRTPPHFAVFETAIGWCGLAWDEGGLLGAQLPEADEAATRTRLRRRFPGAAKADPPPPISAIIDAIGALAVGEPRDFAFVKLDTDGQSPFNLSVYALARAIPPGRTRTYGEIARDLGDVGAARAVGRALGENPWPIVVPCHRVLAAGGRIGGFSANGGVTTKARLLAIEGARTGDAPTLFDHAPTFSLAPKRPGMA
jgi:methylated-DNA-[protein]-cysteine S-methyltransferase